MKSTFYHRWMRQVLVGFFVDRLSFLLYWTAFIWRRLLPNTRFILVTGSLGKTTTKELLAEILQRRGSTFRSKRNQNARSLLSLNILRVRPWHRFAVIEVGTAKPGVLIKSSRLLKPDIAVVLVVAATHQSGFDSLDEIAKEKLSVLRNISPGGIAILNGDDPRLSTVKSTDSIQVLRFGTSEECDLFARNITSLWPDRLSFDACNSNASTPVKTQLVGIHWTPALLAALLTAGHCGVPLSEAAEAAASFRAFPARMQPVRLPSGAIVIRDEYNGSPSSYESALEAFQTAQAERKILIAGDYSDSKIKRRRRLRQLGRTAARLCDLAIFIGEYSHYSRDGAVQAGLDPARAFHFAYLRDAVPIVRKSLRPGDLVLLKSRSNDHLSRLLFAQIGRISCWRPACPERFLCDICWQLGCDESDMKKIAPA